MNSNANKITFCVTCVVAKIVVTHLRNAGLGTASSANEGSGESVLVTGHSATLWRTKVDSNQNRHVICEMSAIKYTGDEL